MEDSVVRPSGCRAHPSTHPRPLLKHVARHCLPPSPGTYANLVKQAKSKQKILDKMEEAGLTKPVQRERTFQFSFPDCAKLPPPVLPFIGVSFAYSGKPEEYLYKVRTADWGNRGPGMGTGHGVEAGRGTDGLQGRGRVRMRNRGNEGTSGDREKTQRAMGKLPVG